MWIATLRSRFAALRVRPAGKAAERPVRAAASAGQGWWDGVLPDCWPLVEWPADAEAPTDYRLSNLPADTPIADLVRLAKVRWRIEHDYRELKHGLPAPGPLRRPVLARDTQSQLRRATHRRRQDPTAIRCLKRYVARELYTITIRAHAQPSDQALAA